MGTVNNDMLLLDKKCVEAFSDADYQVIISAGEMISIEDLGEIPDHISVCRHVDQIAVLQQADVFISHCGMNSVNESLYFGVPLVMLPQTAEQGGVAERVLQFGAGIKLSKTDALSIRDSVERILADGSFKRNAAEIADGFKRCSGAAGAADKIMQVCALSV